VSAGVQFRTADQQVVFEAPGATLSLETGSRIAIEGQSFQVTALSAIVDQGGWVQLYYVQALDPLKSETYDPKTGLSGYPWAGS
jgi:hypothetical protein